MSGLTLCIGSKNLSSWSLRPWLLMRHHGLPFKEIVVALDRPETHERILERSPSGRVPVLLHGRLRVWESLAICEYLAETFALPGAWPMDPAARAFARSVAHEMHSGFADLRRELPFNATRRPATAPVSAAAGADIDRVRAIWSEARSRFGWQGDWLLGPFGIVDAMFAPVALRFAGYAISLGPTETEYVQRVLKHPAIEEWIEAAAQEQPAREAPAALAEPPQKAKTRAAEATAEPVPAKAQPAAVPPPAPAVAAVAAADGDHDDIGEDEMPPGPVKRTPPLQQKARPVAKDVPPPAGDRVRSFILPPD